MESSLAKSNENQEREKAPGQQQQEEQQQEEKQEEHQKEEEEEEEQDQQQQQHQQQQQQHQQQPPTGRPRRLSDLSSNNFVSVPNLETSKIKKKDSPSVHSSRGTEDSDVTFSLSSPREQLASFVGGKKAKFDTKSFFSSFLVSSFLFSSNLY